MKNVRVDCLALCDVEEAERFYESRQPGLGTRFARAVADRFERIQRNPEIYGRVNRELRRCKVEWFPYAVIYRCRGDIFDILFVTHLHRAPGWWQTRARSQ